jgi:hypothetical protein
VEVRSDGIAEDVRPRLAAEPVDVTDRVRQHAADVGDLIRLRRQKRSSSAPTERPCVPRSAR